MSGQRTPYSHYIEISTKHWLDVETKDGNPKTKREICLELAKMFRAAAGGDNYANGVLVHANEVGPMLHSVGWGYVSISSSFASGFYVGAYPVFALGADQYGSDAEMALALVQTCNTAAITLDNFYVFATSNVALLNLPNLAVGESITILGTKFVGVSATSANQNEFVVTGNASSDALNLANAMWAHPDMAARCVVYRSAASLLVGLLPWIDWATFPSCEITWTCSTDVTDNPYFDYSMYIAFVSKQTGTFGNYLPVFPLTEFGANTYMLDGATTATGGSGRFGVVPIGVFP